MIAYPHKKDLAHGMGHIIFVYTMDSVEGFFYPCQSDNISLLELKGTNNNKIAEELLNFQVFGRMHVTKLG